MLPEFAERRATRADAAKRERLAGAMEARAGAARAGPRVADPDYTIAPLDSGPPAGGARGRRAPPLRRGGGRRT